MDIEFFKTAANLGLGALIALVVIYWKRQDDAKHAETSKEMSDRLAHLNDEMREVVKSNTQAMTELRDAIKELPLLLKR